MGFKECPACRGVGMIDELERCGVCGGTGMANLPDTYFDKLQENRFLELTFQGGLSMNEWHNAKDGFPSETRDTWVSDDAGRIFKARFLSPYGAWVSKSFPTVFITVVRWRDI